MHPGGRGFLVERGLSLIRPEPGCPAPCGALWRAVAGCGTGLVALLEDCTLEAWSAGDLESWRPGAWRPGGKDDEAEDEDADE